MHHLLLPLRTQHHHSAEVTQYSCLKPCRRAALYTSWTSTLTPLWQQQPPFMCLPLWLPGCHEGVLLLATGPQVGLVLPLPGAILAASSCERAEHGRVDRGRRAGDPGESNTVRVPHAQRTKWSQAFSCLTFLLKDSYTATFFFFHFLLFDFVFSQTGFPPGNADFSAGPSLCVGGWRTE